MFLVVTRLPDPCSAPTVCAAVTVTGPSGRPLTSTAGMVQKFPAHGADDNTEPICTATAALLTEQLPETTYEAWLAAVMAGAEVTVTTGTAPAVSLKVTRLPDPSTLPTVCAAVTVTAPSGRTVTLRPAADQVLPAHGALAATEPTCTATGVPSAEQVPETVYDAWLAAVIAGAALTVTTGAVPAVSLVVTKLPDPVWPLAVCEAMTVTAPSGNAVTSAAAEDQMPALHCADADTEPL